MGEIFLQIVYIGHEVRRFLRPAVERDQRDLVRRASGQVVEHGGQAAIVLKLAGGRAPRLHQHHNRDRLTVHLLQGNGLRDAIVGEQKVRRLQVGDQLSRGSLHQRRHHDQRRS